MHETWKPAPEWEDTHEVSSTGRCRTLRGRMLTPQHMRGYVLFKMCANGTAKMVFAHKLVLGAFVGPRPEQMECRHLNGDPADNRIGNLAWGTPAENLEDKKAHGTFRKPPPQFGHANGAKIGPQEVRAIRKDNRLLREIAHDYGISVTAAHDIRARKTWKSVS